MRVWVSEALRRREHEVLLLQSQLARHERLASVATLGAGAAHELGTPLATIAIAAPSNRESCPFVWNLPVFSKMFDASWLNEIQPNHDR